MKSPVNYRTFFLMVLLALALSTPLLSQAGGVVVVGKGGGFSEMQAYQFDQNLKPLIDMCLKPENPCDLSQEELRWIQNLSRDLNAMNRPLVQINTSCTTPYLHLEQNGRTSLDACALYQVSGPDNLESPKSAQEILQWVLVAALRSANQGFGDSAAAKIAQGFSQSRLQSFALPLTGGGVRLHLWTGQWAQQSYSFLSIESPKRTLDLTAALQAELRCTSNFSWIMQAPRFQDVSSQQTQAQAPIQWVCGDQKSRGELHLKLQFLEDELSAFEVAILRRSHQ